MSQLLRSCIVQSGSGQSFSASLAISTTILSIKSCGGGLACCALLVGVTLLVVNLFLVPESGVVLEPREFARVDMTLGWGRGKLTSGFGKVWLLLVDF